MKTKSLFLAALIGAAAVSANAGISFGLSVGVPLPVVVTTPVAPAPAALVETAPACPGVDYVWAPGYWAYRTGHYVWVRGSWYYRPVHIVRGHYYGGYRG
jgi:WXXGXW repeat (2 copies)